MTSERLACHPSVSHSLGFYCYAIAASLVDSLKQLVGQCSSPK